MRLIDADAFECLSWEDGEHGTTFDDGVIWMCELIDKQPTIEPERRKGRWISADAVFHGVPFYCSECGENTRDTVMGTPRWKFCPMCGADLREGAEQE